jgi:hypothetical protein
MSNRTRSIIGNLTEAGQVRYIRVFLQFHHRTAIENLLRSGIKTAARANTRAGAGEPKKDMNMVAEAKRFMDESQTVNDNVIVSYLPRCFTNDCGECSRHSVSEALQRHFVCQCKCQVECKRHVEAQSTKVENEKR